MAQWTSWNGNITHQYTKLITPATEEELSRVVAEASSVRVIGNGQSSSDIVAGTDVLIDLREHYNRIVSYDSDKLQITVQAGITLKELLETIEKQSWALPCLPDIDSITLGGALSTGTHGTGKSGQPLSSYVTSYRIVLADGTLQDFSQENLEFNAVKISLGLLGVISSVTLQCVPQYTLELHERPMKDQDWINSYTRMVAEHEFVRVLWLPHTNRGYVITGDKKDMNSVLTEKSLPWFYKYRRAVSKYLYALTPLFPLLTVPANNIIARLFFRTKIRRSGSLYQATVTKSRGSTLELAEWTIPLVRFEETFLELRKELHSLGNSAFAHIPMDVRFIEKDDAWLGYSCEGGTVTIGCVSRNASYPDRYHAFEVVERVLLKHGGRPHWAKRFKTGRKNLAHLYPKWDDFCELRGKLDSTGKFLNDYLRRLFL